MSRPQIQQKLSASNLYDDEPLPPPPLNYRPPQVTNPAPQPFAPQNNGYHGQGQQLTNVSTPDGSDLAHGMAGMHVGQGGHDMVRIFLKEIKGFRPGFESFFIKFREILEESAVFKRF